MRPTAREGEVLFEIHVTAVNPFHDAVPAGTVGKEQ